MVKFILSTVAAVMLSTMPIMAVEPAVPNVPTPEVVNECLPFDNMETAHLKTLFHYPGSVMIGGYVEGSYTHVLYDTKDGTINPYLDMWFDETGCLLDYKWWTESDLPVLGVIPSL